MSDKLGRRISVLIGVASYVIFFVGIAFSPNIQLAYVAAILGILAIFAPLSGELRRKRKNPLLSAMWALS